MSLEVCEPNQNAANWCFGAHLVAYIGINEAAKRDFGGKYKETPPQKEFWLTSSDPDPFSKDPAAINRLYRNLRNIRTHFGERFLEAATTVQLADLHSDGQPGLHRWYLRQLETLNFGRLKTRNFSEFQMRKFADFYRNTPLVAILCQSLYVMAKTINESAAAS